MLAALMHKTSFLWLSLASICVLLFAACTGGVGTTCFQNNECNSGLACCHVGSPFSQGSCQTEEVCIDMGGGTTGGSGGAGGQGGTGGAGAAGGQAGGGGMGGSAGGGGMGGSAGGGGMGGSAGGGGSGGS